MAFTHDPVMHIIRSWNLTPIIESNDDAFGTFASDYVNTWLETHGMMPQFCACGSGEPLTGLFVQLRISSSKLYGLVVCCTQHNDVRNYVMNSPNCLFLPLVDDYANQFAWPGENATVERTKRASAGGIWDVGESSSYQKVQLLRTFMYRLVFMNNENENGIVVGVERGNLFFQNMP